MWIEAHKSMEHAALLTYGSSAATLTFAGLHLSELAIIVSAAASVVGVALQMYVAITKVRLMKRSQRYDMMHRNDHKRGRNEQDTE